MLTRTNTSTTALLVRRGDYANPCMAILSMYNVYIVLQQFSIPDHSSSITIIWLDGHTEGSLDCVWNDLYRTQPIHVKQLPRNMTPFDNDIVVNTMSAIGDEGYNN
jgi:hypothetical protein